MATRGKSVTFGRTTRVRDVDPSCEHTERLGVVAGGVEVLVRNGCVEAVQPSLETLGLMPSL